MIQHFLSSISTEGKVTIGMILLVILFWITWTIIINTPIADKYRLDQFEIWLWQKHGISVSGVFITTLIIVIILYTVWLALGEL
jgi:hypothetical protein